MHENIKALIPVSLSKRVEVLYEFDNGTLINKTHNIVVMQNRSIDEVYKYIVYFLDGLIVDRWR